MVHELQADQSPKELDRTLAKYLKPDLLVIDDMGIKVLPPKSGEALLEIVMRRYETRSTMMTSNRPIEEWGKLLNDVPAATAILDRFLHHAEIIPNEGPQLPSAPRGAIGRIRRRRQQRVRSERDRKQTMSFCFQPWLAISSPNKQPGPAMIGPGGMPAQSTDGWALRLRSRRALSSQTWENNIRKNLKPNLRKY
jgi:hypothetical protein